MCNIKTKFYEKYLAFNSHDSHVTICVCRHPSAGSAVLLSDNLSRQGCTQYSVHSTGRTESGPEVRGCAGNWFESWRAGSARPLLPSPLSLAEQRVAQWGEVMRGKQVRVAAGRVSSPPIPPPRGLMSWHVTCHLNGCCGSVVAKIDCRESVVAKI